jgi:hypothetical protein
VWRVMEAQFSLGLPPGLPTDQGSIHSIPSTLSTIKNKIISTRTKEDE